MKTHYHILLGQAQANPAGYFKTACVELRRHHFRRATNEMLWALQEAIWSLTHNHG